MEMQLFILGHIILYPICVVAISPAAVDETPSLGMLLGWGAFLFVLLEIVYWVLDFIFV